MSQHDGFIKSENKKKNICLLKRSLYVLKQSPRQWYKHFDEYMFKVNFTRCSHGSCVYIKREKERVMVYLLLYVDAMLVASESTTEIQKIKARSDEFEIKDLIMTKKIPGIKIIRNMKDKSLFPCQGEYFEKLLHKFNMHSI